MTEQQIKQLKSILATTADEQNSAELDKTILGSAKQLAPQRKPFWNWSSLSTVGSATLAVLVTVAAFWTMSIALKPTELIAPLATINQEVEFEVKPQTIESGVQDKLSVALPEEPPLYQRSSGETKEQILASLDLLNTDKLLDNMPFPLAKDRQSAKLALNTAMADINQMISGGQVKDARKRYDRLRRSCQVCTLPLTLEALALAGNDKVNRL